MAAAEVSTLPPLTLPFAPTGATLDTYTLSNLHNQETSSSDDDSSPRSSVGMPGSPPDLSLSCSKSSKSSFHSYQSDDNDIVADAGHFEDIGLDDDVKSVAEEQADFVGDLQFKSPFASERPLKGMGKRSKSMGNGNNRQRDLTAPKGRPQALAKLSGQSFGHQRKPTGEVHGLGLNIPGAPRRNNSVQSLNGLSALHLNMVRSRSPALSPHSAVPGFPGMPRSRRGSWQSNTSRKTAKELEMECDEEDGDDIPDECFLPNVPMSPRPPNERTATLPVLPSQQVHRKPRQKSAHRPAGNGTPPVPQAQGTLRQAKPPGSPGLKPPRAKSWTAAMGDLSFEARELTEKLESHADENDEFNPYRRARRQSTVSINKRSRSVVSQLPPIRKGDVMIDPLPVSREKMAVLSRTRPSWLPPKDPLEEKRHLKQYQAMMAASAEAERRREAKPAVLGRNEERDDLNSSLLRIWEDHVLPNWEAATSLKRTRELWWRGVAPRSRGAVWVRAIGNDLGLTTKSYEAALKRAKTIEKRLSKGNAATQDDKMASSLTAIKRDIANTFPDFKIFAEGGPLNEGLKDVLMAYSVYRADVGYVEGLNVSSTESTVARFSLIALPMNISSPIFRPVRLYCC